MCMARTEPQLTATYAQKTATRSVERHCEAVNHISEAATHIMSRKGKYQSRAMPAQASPRTKQEAGGIEGKTHSPASQNRRPHSSTIGCALLVTAM